MKTNGIVAGLTFTIKESTNKIGMSPRPIDELLKVNNLKVLIYDTPTIISVIKGNVTGDYSIKLSSGEVFNVNHIGKQRFIEKVVKQVKQNKTPREFICPEDESKEAWGDKIVWNGKEFKYYDLKHKNIGTVIIKSF